MSEPGVEPAGKRVGTGGWTVARVMTCPAITIRWDADFKSVVEMIARAGVSALPVVDEDGRLMGIVSEADLLAHQEAGPSGPHLPIGRSDVERRAEGRTAIEVMTRPVFTIGAHESLAAAARLMRSKRVKRLVVVDADGCVEGVVSRIDLLRIYLRPDAEIRQEIEVIQRDVLGLEGGEPVVTVAHGVVGFGGRLANRSDTELLRALAGRVAGVVAVEGELSYDYDDVGATAAGRVEAGSGGGGPA